jgi:hypothetical protein
MQFFVKMFLFLIVNLYLSFPIAPYGVYLILRWTENALCKHLERFSEFRCVEEKNKGEVNAIFDVKHWSRYIHAF